MSVVRIFGIPEETTEIQFKALYEDLVVQVSSVRGMDLAEGVTIFFPKDRMACSCRGNSIIVLMDGFFVRLCSPRICSELAAIIGKTIKKHFPAAFVRCRVKHFDPEEKMWSSSSLS